MSFPFRESIFWTSYLNIKSWIFFDHILLFTFWPFAANRRKLPLRTKLINKQKRQTDWVQTIVSKISNIVRVCGVGLKFWSFSSLQESDIIPFFWNPIPSKLIVIQSWDSFRCAPWSRKEVPVQIESQHFLWKCSVFFVEIQFEASFIVFQQKSQALRAWLFLRREGDSYRTLYWKIWRCWMT